MKPHEPDGNRAVMIDRHDIIEGMKCEGRVRLNGWAKFYHYSLGWMFLAFSGIIIRSMSLHAFKIDPAGRNYVGGMTPVLLGMIAMTISLFVRQSRILRFRVIDQKVSAEAFEAAARAAGQEMGWGFSLVGGSFAQATSGFTWRSWGERITIIRDGDRVLFNSICDPDQRPSVASWGRNRMNRKCFERHLFETTYPAGDQTS